MISMLEEIDTEFNALFEEQNQLIENRNAVMKPHEKSEAYLNNLNKAFEELLPGYRHRFERLETELLANQDICDCLYGPFVDYSIFNKPYLYEENKRTIRQNNSNRSIHFSYLYY